MNALFGDDGFQLALVYSAGLAVIALVLAHSVRVRVGFATVAVVATLLAFHEQYRLPDRLVIGVGLLAVAGACASFIRPAFLRCFAAIPGAAFVALSLVGVPRWVKGVVFVAIVVGAPLLAASDRRAPRVAPPLFLVTVAGVYACVPDTEFARILVGAFLAAAFLAFDPDLRAVAAGASAAAGVIMWDAGQEGWARPGAVIGAVACMGALLLIPMFARRLVLTNPWSASAWWVAAVHVGLVLWCSRVAGFRHSAWVAAVLVVPAYVVAAGALMLLRRVRTPPRAA
jgi:hypothetical protein